MKNTKNNHQPNLWGMIQNVLQTAMARGQLLPAGLVLGVLIGMIKMPSQDILYLFKSIYFVLQDWQVLGWGISIFLSLGWVYQSKKARVRTGREIDRMAQEKSELQQKLNDRRRLKSSKKK